MAKSKSTISVIERRLQGPSVHRPSLQAQNVIFRWLECDSKQFIQQWYQKQDRIAERLAYERTAKRERPRIAKLNHRCPGTHQYIVDHTRSSEPMGTLACAVPPWMWTWADTPVSELQEFY